MNKFDLINRVLVGTLKADDKNLLIELIGRTHYDKHGNWDCWPSVQRLCQVRGIKHEKNFEGADFYLPGLVQKRKAGRKNVYTIDVEAIMQLPAFDVTIKHTPAAEGLNTPAIAADTPSVVENTPSVEGANSTSDTTRDSSIESTEGAAVAAAPATPVRVKPEESQDSSRFSGLIVNRSSGSKPPAGRPADAGPTEGKEAQLREKVRTYRRDLTDNEVDAMVSSMLAPEELRRMQDEVRRRHQEADEAREKELTW
jgi:hypothetical protein